MFWSVINQFMFHLQDTVVIKNRKRKKSDKAMKPFESLKEQVSKSKYSNFVDSTEVYHDGQTQYTSKKRKVIKVEKSDPSLK